MASRQAWSRFATASQPLAHRALAQPTTSSFALRHIARSTPAAAPAVTKTTSPSAPITFVRLAHNIPRPKPASQIPAAAQSSGTNNTAPANPVPERGLAPHYELTFTCLPCGTRSSHKVTKQGYHQGSVLIACPECRNRHIISDHLGIFGGLTKGEGGETKGRTIEDIMREKGKLVKKGTLGEDGDIEFWEDGSTTDRQTRLAAEDVMLPRSNKKPATDENGEDAAPGSTFQSAGKS
ncbi:hypothetical protein SBRCBS47491_007351 [Sporothrix bragantina]|uniref:DNL-type domain-containing protein n=1 Tax=Sporothrix bragantina TaxID=671064 RepID=A0ABP0CCJ2_9PEZI